MALFLFTSIVVYESNALRLYRPPLRNITSSTDVPGLEYISRGYNIMFGNPHSTGTIDEGISGVIFDLMNVSNGEMYKNYSVPNGVSVLSSPTCTQKFTYNAVTGANSYSDSLTQDTSFDTRGWGAAFSASVDYQSVYKETSTQETVFTSTYTQCSCYAASLNLPFDLPSFSENFVKTIANMPNEYDINNETNNQFFYDFFTNYFGTHYISGITMGGIFGTLSSMNSFSYSTFSSSNLDISISASYSCLAASAAVDSMTDTQKNISSDFDSITTSKKIFNIGGDLPSDNNAASWQETLSSNPLPIYYKFEAVPNLLQSAYFPQIGDIEKKQSALQTALSKYCSILAENDTFGVIECAGYLPDASIPGKSIIKGFYADNKDNEPMNPYTKGYSCDDGYEPIPFYEYWDSVTSDHFNGYYCLNKTMNKKDDLRYFGGFYQNCNDYEHTNVQCNEGNYFLDSAEDEEDKEECKCPNGYSAVAVSTGFSNHFAANCWHENNWSILETFMCYNASVPLTETIIAGMYSIAPDGQGELCDVNLPNPYTKTTFCSVGFTAYLVGKQCCSSNDGHCSQESSTYVCLNNIYPV